MTPYASPAERTAAALERIATALEDLAAEHGYRAAMAEAQRAEQFRQQMMQAPPQPAPPWAA
jgi:hypothetical protein